MGYDDTQTLQPNGGQACWGRGIGSVVATSMTTDGQEGQPTRLETEPEEWLWSICGGWPPQGGHGIGQ